MATVSTSGTLAKSPRELRAEVESLMRDDLIGPLGGPEEELADAPVDRYLLGLLAPRFSPGARSQPGGEGDEDPVAADAQPDDELAKGSARLDTGEEGSTEDRPPAAEQLVPSAFGMTFALAPGVDRLALSAHWGAYSRETSAEQIDPDGRAKRVWKRRSCGGEETISVPDQGPLQEFAPDPDEPDVRVRGLVRATNGHRLVSLFLVNGQQADGGRAVAAWLCQAELAAAAPDGTPVFIRRALDVAAHTPDVDREELAGLEMLHRHFVELAAGHGIGVEATCPAGDPDRGTRIATVAMPAEEVPLTEAPTPDDFADRATVGEPFGRAVEALDMWRLSQAADEELLRLLEPLVDAYEAWVGAEEQRVSDPPARLAGHEATAALHLAGARDAARRMRLGIAALAEPLAAEAFRFANHAMWQQRIHTTAAEARRRDPGRKLDRAVADADEPANRSWRPFQLAFVLLGLPSLADPTHPERDGASESSRLVDLLFFPTGGGKTEAYLGLSAFAIAIRRLQGSDFGLDASDGVAVLMRYTLRLLTLQQFQRATALLCACELRRRALYGDGRTAEQRRWGRTPMRIGLWVGRASTPNSTARAEEWVQRARQPRGGKTSAPRGSSPLQLARCPWCGSELDGGRDVEVDSARGRTLVLCSDSSGQCPFTPRKSPNEGLPIVVVDEELYRLLPALVIATVDKLAQMPWEGRAAALFGQVTRHCERHGFLTPSDPHDVSSHPARGGLPAVKVEPQAPLRPPDLIIQDELHLISGPLGSLVGLYETAVDELSSWTAGDRRVRPKVIASTATIRRARDQVKRLFDRELAVFPPPGLDARDSFFALQRDRPEEVEGKPGRRYLGVCAPGRRYKQVLIRVYVAQLRAAWHVLGRQPGGAADAYMTLVGYFNSLRELGGMRRLVEDDVQSRLFRLDERPARGRLVIEELTSRKTAAEIPRTLDQLGVGRLSQDERKTGDEYSIDVLLATNMISVGVDVPRLGAMIVAGQPKSTSEYIQATSRVGRSYPGLVVAVYNWARPRDLSHYETFGHYHRTLYRQVEALSVTPFAPRAVDRGLTGVLASLLRLCDPALNHNRGAAAVTATAEPAVRALATLRDRADDQLGQPGADALAERVTHRLQAWEAEKDIGQRTLVYRRWGARDTDVPLLKEPDTERWDPLWTVPMSLRNVEAAVPLALRPDGVVRATDDWDAPERSASVPKERSEG